MFWILTSAVAVLAAIWLLSDGHDPLDYRAREIRAAMMRRESSTVAEMRRVRRARRCADRRAAVQRTRLALNAVGRAPA